jgi:DNA-binding response OmpR family regulator
MDDLSDLKNNAPRPTPLRPLLGVTVLIVEDSRYASEALRLLCLRSGARIRRADCLASARRHLTTYRPTVAIVDIGLPDGSGLELIRTLNHATQRPPIMLATSGNHREEAEFSSIEAGADGFLPKPIESLAAFQQAILRHMPEENRPMAPRIVSADTVTPDSFAMDEDLAHVAKLMDDEGVPASFISGFIKGVARTGHDEALLREAEAFEMSPAARDRLRGLIAQRLQRKQAV